MQIVPSEIQGLPLDGVALTALTSLAAAINSATDAPSLVWAIAHHAEALVPHERLTLAVKFGTEDAYRVWQADRVLGTLLAQDHPHELQQGVIGWVLERGEATFSLDVSFDGNPEHARVSPTAPSRGGLAFPLEYGGDVFGVICFESAEGVRPAAERMAAGSLIAHQVATAARNVQLSGELGLADDMIFTLATAIEAKDPYTQGHCGRVAHYAVLVGERFALPKSELRILYKGAFLHDIGKIGVRDAVLLKDGPLTEDEYTHIKEHPSIGARILNNLAAASTVVPAVLYHHERWDGHGYPAGLIGVEIPLLARIVSVVDAFDAMTTTRCYRPAFDVSKALTILAAGAGSQWDPQVVEAFVDVISERDHTTLGTHELAVSNRWDKR